MPLKDLPSGKRRRKANQDKESDEETEVEKGNASTADADLDVSLSRGNNEIPENGEEGALQFRDIYIPPPAPSTCSFDNKGPRLIVKTIVVNNFKSFYGEHTIGPFFKGMSAVIGPNGSGKSNVLDSILFVFGYRASKIRTKKVAMLIHNSSNHNNLPSCSVTVNFMQIIDKGPNEDPEEIPNSELVVSRTAMRDSTSYYTLDGKRAQFKDVAAKLQNHGIDLTNGRFLILQGEVEQIALMKPKGENENDIGLLEFLEDIMGTLRYREPLAKAVEIYNQLDEVREAQSEKVGVVEKALKALGEGKDEAIKYLENDNKILRVRYKICQKHIYENEKKMRFYEAEKAKVVEKLEEIKKEVTDAHTKTKQAEATIKQRTEELEKMQKVNEKRDADYQIIKNKDTQLREDMTARGARRTKIRNNLKTEEKKLNDLRGLPEKNTKEIAELENLIARHEKDRSAAQESLDKATKELHRDLQEPQQEKEKLEERLKVLAKEREDKSSAYRICQSKLEICTKGETQEKEKLEKLTNNLEEIKVNFKQKNKRVDELNKDLPRAKQKLAELSETLDTERGERARVDQRVAKLRSELQGVRVAAEKAKSRNRVVASLMEQCSLGNIPGIFGRLGDLGAIEAKYDCAISSSCGSLDHIVVDKVDTGEKCINYLRNAGIGRGNFLVLEKLQTWGDKGRYKFTAPENVPRLFDLVKVEDERVLPAFYFALRDTLVAKDIEQASRIGLGGRVRFRVVDINGNIVEPGGTITGGGQPIRGRMGQRVTAGLASEKAAEDTPQLRQNLEQLEARSSALMQNILKLEQTGREMRTKVPELENEYAKLNREVKHLHDSIPRLEQQIADQKEIVNRTNTDQNQVKQLKEDAQKSGEALKKATEAADKYEVQIKKLSKQMDEKKNSKIGGLDGKVKDLTKKINKAQADKTKLSAGIASVERNIQKSEEKIADMAHEIKRLEEEINNLKIEWEPITAKALALLNLREECSDEILKQGAEIDDLREEQKKIIAEELEFKKKKHAVEVEVDKVNTKVLVYKDKAEEYKTNLLAMKLEDIPGAENIDPFHVLTDEELEITEFKDLEFAITTITDGRAPRPNMAIIEEHRVKQAQFVEMSHNLEEAIQRHAEMKNFVNLVRRTRYKEFMHGFKIINQKLKEVFRMISMGGDAELELQDTFNPFLEGIAFSVRPRNKAWTQIDRLSGGEKTLSSLALVFGLHYYKPSPFYMMDEIDAALDARNVSIIGHYIKQFTVNCQFIVISLRPEMYDLFERRVIGIFKPDGCSLTVCVDPGDFRGQEVEQEPESQDSFENFMDSSVNISMDESMSQTAETSIAGKTNKEGLASKATSSKSSRKSIRSKNPVASYEDVDISLTESPEVTAKRVRQENTPTNESADEFEKETSSPTKRKSGQTESLSDTTMSPPPKRKGRVVQSAATLAEDSPTPPPHRGGKKAPETKSPTVIPASDEDNSPAEGQRRSRRRVKEASASGDSSITDTSQLSQVQQSRGEVPSSDEEETD